jgi:hypothetical protein
LSNVTLLRHAVEEGTIPLTIALSLISSPLVILLAAVLLSAPSLASIAAMANLLTPSVAVTAAVLSSYVAITFLFIKSWRQFPANLLSLGALLSALYGFLHAVAIWAPSENLYSAVVASRFSLYFYFVILASALLLLHKFGPQREARWLRFAPIASIAPAIAIAVVATLNKAPSISRSFQYGANMLN